MTRTKLDDRVLPTYSKGEEITNMTSHIVGAAFGIVATVLCIVTAASHSNGYGVVSGTIYGITMIVLYTMSSIYHGLSPKLKGKKVMQVIDHCSVFLLIAGSYTPFALCGIVLNAIDLKRFRVFSMICYLAMGWCIILKINVLPELITTNGFILLVAGGIIYTIGAILYGLGRKIKYMHSIFHFCILIASILQFFCILFYVM